MEPNNINKQQDVENTNLDMKKIENDIEELLRISGFQSDNEGQRAHEVLRHLYTAVSMFEKMDEDEQTIIAAMQKKLRGVFEVRCTLKKRKTRKSKRLPSPSSLSLQKEYKEKVAENLSIVERDDEAGFDGEAVARTRKKRGRKGLRETLPFRKNDFLEECKTFGDKYDHGMINSFFHYWAQENRSGKKMRFEMEKTWNTAMRLAGWAERSYQHDNEAAKLRLERAKKLGKKDTANVEQQKQIAVIREQENAKREAEMEEARKGSISLEEYAKTHPDSNLAKRFLKKEHKEV
jgi:hypothetical protein